MFLLGMYIDIERGWETLVELGELGACEAWGVVL